MTETSSKDVLRLTTTMFLFVGLVDVKRKKPQRHHILI